MIHLNQLLVHAQWGASRGQTQHKEPIRAGTECLNKDELEGDISLEQFSR